MAGVIDADGRYVSDIYTQNRFFLCDNREVHWVYHNPDAESGDQFVVVVINGLTYLRACSDAITQVFDEINADKITPKESAAKLLDYFWDNLQSSCRQYLHDVGTDTYEGCRSLFESAPWALGLNTQTLRTLGGLYL